MTSVITVKLPFPPSILSGHVNGNGRWKKIAETKRWRAMAKDAVAQPWPDQGKGDIRLHLHFVPPDRRGDRLNYVNRCKGLVDGLADGLGVNDRRFLPSISYGEPQKPGCVIVTIGGE